MAGETVLEAATAENPPWAMTPRQMAWVPEQTGSHRAPVVIWEATGGEPGTVGWTIGVKMSVNEYHWDFWKWIPMVTSVPN